MKSRSLLFLLVFITFCASPAFSQDYKIPPILNDEWIKDYAPFRIAGNLYYVGTHDLACYLVTTREGHILINTGTVESTAMIMQHVEALGFRLEDVKILLNSQAHYDHVGAMALLREKTSARVMAHERDADVMEDGGYSDYIFGGKKMFDPIKVDRRLRDNDTIALGEIKIRVLHHPGHTKGSTSFLFDVQDSARSYRVLIANMPTILSETKFPSMSTYPEVKSDYAYSFRKMKDLQFDIWLAAHASQFSLHKKRKAGDAYKPQAFMERAGYDEYLADLQKEYNNRSINTSKND